MRKLSEMEIKDILRNRDQKIESIHKKMFHLYQELEHTDEIMESAAFPSTNYSGLPGGKGGHKDLGDVLLKYNRQLYNRNEEIRRIMWELVEEEDSISRLWACFYGLGDPYYSILNALYVENQLYQTVEDSFDVSHKTFEKYRQKGIELLLRFYESDESIAKLMRRYGSEKDNSQKTGKDGKNKKQKEDTYEQISLSSLQKKEDLSYGD